MQQPLLVALFGSQLCTVHVRPRFDGCSYAARRTSLIDGRPFALPARPQLLPAAHPAARSAARLFLAMVERRKRERESPRSTLSSTFVPRHGRKKKERERECVCVIRIECPLCKPAKTIYNTKRVRVSLQPHAIFHHSSTSSKRVKANRIMFVVLQGPPRRIYQRITCICSNLQTNPTTHPYSRHYVRAVVVVAPKTRRPSGVMSASVARPLQDTSQSFAGKSGGVRPERKWRHCRSR